MNKSNVISSIALISYGLYGIVSGNLLLFSRKSANIVSGDETIYLGLSLIFLGLAFASREIQFADPAYKELKKFAPHMLNILALVSFVIYLFSKEVVN